MTDYNMHFDMAQYLRHLFQSAKKRARKCGIDFSLDQEWCFRRFEARLGHCEVSGVKYSLHKIRGCTRRPYAPSIDRISSGLGYTPANCRLICVGVNISKNEWPDDVLLKLAKGIVWMEENNPTHTSLRLKNDNRVTI